MGGQLLDGSTVVPRNTRGAPVSPAVCAFTRAPSCLLHWVCFSAGRRSEGESVPSIARRFLGCLDLETGMRVLSCTHAEVVLSITKSAWTDSQTLCHPNTFDQNRNT